MIRIQDVPAEVLEAKPLPSISADYRDYPCPTCHVTDWMVRPNGTMSCFHCLIHMSVTVNWCPRCGKMRG